MKCVMCGQRNAMKDSVLCGVCRARPASERVVLLKALLDSQPKVLLGGKK
jgi:hypothetical protein